MLEIHVNDRTQDFWNQQAAWSQATFGKDSERGPVGPLKHLEKEAKEAVVEASMLSGFKGLGEDYQIDVKVCEKDLREEIADCLFLTFDAARRAGMTLTELVDTAFRKLEKNKNREWQKPTSDDEPIEHVRHDP